MNIPGICIPRLPQMTNWKKIKYSFEKLLGIGTVKRVEIVNRNTKKGVPYQSAYISFYKWTSTEQATAIRERLYAGQHINVVYDEGSPWFWRCTLTRQ